MGQGVQEGLGDGKKPGVVGVLLVGEPATKAFDQAFLVSASSGGVVSNGRQMGTAPTDESTDQGGESIEVAFAVSVQGKDSVA